jgi:hypothetical protein
MDGIKEKPTKSIILYSIAIVLTFRPTKPTCENKTSSNQPFIRCNLRAGRASANPLPPTQWASIMVAVRSIFPIIKFTSDAELLLRVILISRTGCESSTLGDYWDLWIVKLDKCGVIQWEKSFGNRL